MDKPSQNVTATQINSA